MLPSVEDVQPSVVLVPAELMLGMNVVPPMDLNGLLAPALPAWPCVVDCVAVAELPPVFAPGSVLLAAAPPRRTSERATSLSAEQPKQVQGSQETNHRARDDTFMSTLRFDKPASPDVRRLAPVPLCAPYPTSACKRRIRDCNIAAVGAIDLMWRVAGV